MKKILIALTVLGIAYGCAAWTTGRIAERQMDSELARLKGLLPNLKITEDQHTRGVFGSTRVTTVDVAALFNSGDCAAPEASGDHAGLPPAMGKPPVEPIQVTVKQVITHGPLPGFGLPAAAAVRYEWRVNGQPLGKQPGVQAEGDLPVLRLRYGFTGNSHIAVSGGAGKLVYEAEDGSALTLAWPSLTVSGSSKSDLSAVDYEARLPELVATFTTPKGEAATINLKGLGFNGDLHYPVAGNLFVSTGRESVSLANLAIARNGKTVFEAEGLDGKGSSTLNEGLMDSSSQLALTSVKMGGEVAGPLHLDFTLARFDAIAYGAMVQSLMSNDLGQCPTPEKTAAFVAQFTRQLPALLRSGPQLQVDRLSVGYEGQEARLSGKLSLSTATAEQLENFTDLLPRISARLDIAVPDALLKALAIKRISGQMAGETAATEGGTSPDGPTPEQRAEAEGVAQAMVAQQVEQALAQNWIVRSQNGIASSVEYRDGKVVLNGQPLDFQGLRSGTPAAE